MESVNRRDALKLMATAAVVVTPACSEARPREEVTVSAPTPVESPAAAAVPNRPATPSSR